MEIPDYLILAIVPAIVSAIVSGIVAATFSRFSFGPKLDKIDKRLVKIETKLEPFWKGVKNGVSKALGGSPPTARTKELLDKCEARTLTLEEAKELKSIAEKCFENAKQKHEHQKMTYLTLLIGTLDVMIEELMKKVELKKTQ